MKKATILILFLTFAFAHSQELNYFANWEFDDGINNWIFWDGSPDADAAYYVDENAMLSGDYSLRWEIVNGGPNSWYVQTYQMVPCYEGVEYYLDFLVAYEGPETLNVYWVWELAVDPYTKYASKDTFVTAPLTRMQAMVIPTDTDETANFKIFLGLNNDAFVWLDRIYLSEVPLEIDDEVELRSDGPAPAAFSLQNNYPNPFNPATTINFSLPENSRARLSVYDILGREIVTLMDDDKSMGDHSCQWDGTDHLGERVPSGIYFYQLQAGDFIAVKKMVLTQ